MANDVTSNFDLAQIDRIQPKYFYRDLRHHRYGRIPPFCLQSQAELRKHSSTYDNMPDNQFIELIKELSKIGTKSNG